MDDAEKLKKQIEIKTAGVDNSDKKTSPKKVGIGIRTYAADIANIMREEKGSIIKIALAEQERRQNLKEKRDPTSTKNLIVILLGITFIVAGVLIFVYFIVNRDNPVTVNTPVSGPSLIYSENQTQIDMSSLTRGNFFKAIHSNMDGGFAENGTITNLMITTPTSIGRAPVGIFPFFDKLGIKAPDAIKNLMSQVFMLGVYTDDGEGNLFLIFKVSDFNASFSAMKEWEVSLANDLVRLFRIDPQSFEGDIFLKEFKSDVVFNKQARNLYDDSGSLVLSYVYIDGNTIIITNDAESVEEVIKRINSQSIR